MLSHHRRLFAFDRWATFTVLDAVEPVHDRVPAAIARLNHMLGASRVWLARVTGGSPPFGLEASFGPADLRQQFAAAHDLWNAFLDTQSDADLARVIVYGPNHVALGDILTHLPLHGQHHRGQINVDLRAAGIAPPSIDYVHAARQGRF